MFITDRGKPAYVPLSIDDYDRLTVTGAEIAELLAFPGDPTTELKIPARRDVARAADLS